MEFLVKQGSKMDYKYKEVYCDEETDIVSVNKMDCCPGSIIYVIATGNVYMLNTKRE